MSFRLPSQKKFAPGKPKLGSRPGGPTTGGPPKAPSAAFVKPLPPVAAPVAPAQKVANPNVAELAAAGGNAVAGPSSRPDVPPGLGSGSALPADGNRQSPSPVTRPSGLPETTGSSGNAGPSGSSRQRSRSPSATNPTESTARASSSDPPPAKSSLTQTSPLTQSTLPKGTVDPDRPPLSVSQRRRTPSASPAPPNRGKAVPISRASSRVSASPAPSIRQRSMSRQPSLTPSMRSGGRPALIAAAENRSSPLNIPPSAKARRKAEKAREAEAERESERGTPAPTSIAIPGLPPMLAAAPRDDEDVDMEHTDQSRAGSHTTGQRGGDERAGVPRSREVTAAIAARLVDQMRASTTPAASVPGDRARTPLFLPGVPEDEDEHGSEYGRDNGGMQGGEESDSGEEEYDEETGQIIRKGGVAVSQIRKKATKAPPKPKVLGRPIATQRKKYTRKPRPKTPRAEEDEEEEGDDDDDGDGAELNELDISDNDDLSLSTQAGRKKSLKRKRKAPRSPVFQPVNLDEAEVGQLIGEEVDEDSMRMAEIATKRSGEGKVSARAKELSVYLRDFNQRNRSRLDEEINERYERRQILRRQIRALRNGKRVERREVIRERGGDPDVEISEDEPDSETEFDLKPERLTPETTPEPGGARPQPELDDDEIEEEEFVEPPEGTIPAGLGDEDDEDEDGEGGAEAEEEPEEEIFNPNALMDERHEDEPMGHDPELAAMGFGLREGDDEMYDENAGETMDDLLDQVHHNRRTAQRYNDTREVVEEEQTGKMPNSRSYAKKMNNERWSPEETEFFYQVLGETGENYTLMSFYFPSRTPRQLKNKGRKENMLHPDRVNEAIRARRPIDPEYLQKTVGYDPRGPTDDADQLLEETRDLPARWTREDTDRVLADVAEEDEDGNRVEEVNYDEAAAAAGAEAEADGEREDGKGDEEDGDKGDEDDEDGDEEDEEQGDYAQGLEY